MLERADFLEAITGHPQATTRRAGSSPNDWRPT
jgi:hypothetical protein